MHLINQVINFLANQPTSTYTTILSYLGGSTLVATLLQLVKHKLNLHEAKKLLTYLLGLFSFLAAFADMFLSATAQNPLILGKNTAYLITGAVFIHRFAVSPLYRKITASANQPPTKTVADPPEPTPPVSEIFQV